MKKLLILSSVIIALAALSFITPPDTLVGRWQKTYRGVTALAAFRTNNTFDVFMNGKLFTSGKYTVRQDTLALADAGCNAAYYGTYKLGFFAGDSVRFVTIQDTCEGRKNTMHNATMGRVKPGEAKAAKP